jgi:hypothetical protein
MRKYAALVLLTTSGAAVAQTNCPPPTLKVLRNNQEVLGTGAALAPRVTLQVSPSPECPDKATYQFKVAELTLMRGQRPLTPTMNVRQPEANLKYFMSVAQPGDRLYVFVSYENLMVVSANGEKSPYSRPMLNPNKQSGLDLRTDAGKGISLNWQIVQK